MSLHRLRTNAFWVLEIPFDASRAQVERATARLLDELDLDRKSAHTVTTPLGEVARTPELVREVADRLRSSVGRGVERELAQLCTASAPEVLAVVALNRFAN